MIANPVAGTVAARRRRNLPKSDSFKSPVDVMKKRSAASA